MLFTAKNFFGYLSEKKVDVIGFGVSHSQLVFMLAENGATVTLHDKMPLEKFDPEQLKKFKSFDIALNLGENYLDNLNGEVIFRTPGMPFTHPALQQARAKGKIVTSELEVFLQCCPCPTFGVTGSDGKTTTSSIIAEILRKTGRKVHLGGNIGRALLPVLDIISPEDYCVVELSSFQLLSMGCSPDVAVVTNITPNHLDVHKDMEEYISAKKNILLHQTAFGKAVLSEDNQGSKALSDIVRGKLYFFSRTQKVENGAWLDEEGNLCYSNNGKSIPVINKKELAVPGLHNVENALTAITAVWGYATPKQICEGIRAFKGVEHRIELVREKDGVRWFNDSIATSPSRMVAGLRSFNEKLVAIAGGYDKNIPFAPIVDTVLERVKLLVLMGATAEKIKAEIISHPSFEESGIKIIMAESLADAVAIADKEAVSGDVVALSPACASFDSFKNFEERGSAFKALVYKL